LNFSRTNKKKTEYKNSIDYLNRLSNIKEKWADAFRKKIFTAGTHTTSRAESVNALFKRYMTRNCEISDIIYLLENIQRISCVQDFSSKNIVLKDTDEFIESEPVLMDLRILVSKQIFIKHLLEFKIFNKYATKFLDKEGEDAYSYNVYL